jgi:Chitobiase/beta-hexosaminidase C-terminal domain
MNISRIIVAMVLLLTLAIYGKNFDWVPSAEASDTTDSVINVLVDGKALVTEDSNQVNLPALIVFTSEEPAIIYYTTNGSDPTTETTTFSTIATAGGAAAGPTISSADTILKTLGEIKTSVLTSVQRYLFVTP